MYLLISIQNVLLYIILLALIVDSKLSVNMQITCAVASIVWVVIAQYRNSRAEARSKKKYKEN